MRNLERNAKEGESKRYLAPRPGLEPGTCGLTVTFTIPLNTNLHTYAQFYKSSVIKRVYML